MDTALNVDLRQMIFAIETAVSLVGMNDTNHGKRVGFIASQFGHLLDYDVTDLDYLFELGLLHDCGVSTEQMHASLANNFDWEEADTHCRIGYRLLKDFEPLASFALPVLYHHTPWQDFTALQVDERVARMANLIFLADRVDVTAAPHYGGDILLARDELVATIRQHAGSYFNPEFVEAFAKTSRYEAFWIGLEDRHITRYAWDMGRRRRLDRLSFAQLKQLALILAYIVDQKSPFTREHSLRVADLARFLAARQGLTETQCAKVEIAGLLHDLGKLHTPDRVLEKPGPLNPSERAIMNQHSYETYEILRHIEGLEEVARWAAFHHEGVNGGGYPFHPQRRELSIEARIIAVADVFQALVQKRPYRNGLPLPEVLQILTQMAQDGKLDSALVALAHQHSAACFAIAQGRDPLLNQPYIDFSVEPAAAQTR